MTATQSEVQQQPGQGTLTPEQHKLWKNRLERAKTHHQPYWDLADLIRQTFLGKHDAEAKEDVKQDPVNLVSSFVSVSLPQVLPENPYPMVDPEYPGDEYAEGAKRLEARSRQVFGRTASYRQLRRALLDAYFLRGYIVTVWTPTTSRYAAMPEQKEGGKGVPASEPTGNAPDLPPDEPAPLHVGYRDVLIDPDAASFDAAAWVCYVVEKSLSDIKASDVKNGGPYHDTDQVKGGVEGKDDSGRSSDQEDARANVYTIFHRGRRLGEVGVLVLAGTDRTEIRHDYVEFGTPGFPIRQIEFQDVGRLFPASPVQFWLDLCTSFNEFVVEATERASQSKQIVVCATEEIRNSVATAKGMDTFVSKDVENGVKVHSIGGLHPDTIAAGNLFERLVDKISGVADFQRGIGSEGDKTATEVQWMVEYTKTRLGDLQAAARRALRDVATDIGGMLLTHQWQPVPVRIDEGPGQVRFETFSASDVPGPLSAYAYDFDVADQARQNPVVRAKRTQDTLELIANPAIQQAAAAEGKQISVTAALEDHLEAIGVRDVKRYVKDLPTPQELAQQQAEKAQAENQEMAATGQPAMVDPAGDNHAVHVSIHRQAVDNPVVAEHLAEHYGYMAASQGGAVGAPTAGEAGARVRGPVGGTGAVETPGQLAGTAGRA